MSIVKLVKCQKDGDNLRYYYVNENNEIESALEPLMVDGAKNPRVDMIVGEVKQTMAEIQAKKSATNVATKVSPKVATIVKPAGVVRIDDNAGDNIPEPEEEEVILEGENIAEPTDEALRAEYEDVPEEKKKSWIPKVVAGGLIAAALIGAGYGIANYNSQEVDQTPVSTESQVTIDDLKEDSRFTEITNEDLVQTTQDFVEALKEQGIDVDSADALTFVSVANMTHIQETNPELYASIFADKDPEQTLVTVGHMIGKIVTNEITTKNQSFDWTQVFMDDTDRLIALHGNNYVLNESKTIYANSELSDEEKVAQIQNLVESKFVAPNFDTTVGYTFEDGTVISKSQEDGADFITDAIITGVFLGDNDLKNVINAENTYKDTKDSTWVETTEYGMVSADLKAISENVDNVSNIMRMIENCQEISNEQAEVSQETTKTK